MRRNKEMVKNNSKTNTLEGSGDTIHHTEKQTTGIIGCGRRISIVSNLQGNNHKSEG
jgi:hypothetical protein